MEDLKKKYEELTRKLAIKEDKSTAAELMDNTDLHFTNRVLGFPLPVNFKMPRVDKYDGNGDPAEHMESIRTHFSFHRTPDEIACRIFPLTLAGVAKDWFARLPAKSRKEESLKDFMLRFNREKLLVESPNDQTVLSALWHRVRPNGPLMAEISKSLTEITLRQFVNKMEEYTNQEEMIGALMKGQEEEDRAKEDNKKKLPALWHRVRPNGPLMAEISKSLTEITLRQFVNKMEEYTIQEEMIGALMKGQEEEDRAKKDNKKKLPATSTPKEGKLQKKVGKKVVPSFLKIESQRREDRRFTSLNVGVNEVFMEEITRDPAFRWPNKLRGDPRKRDRVKFCEYHNDHGHLTEDCVTLQQEIKTFIRNGRLVRFLARERNRDAVHQ
ncbi:uncharacterized protein LOC132165149 [Corylus avellana]|uniref:uncharacterized protein LOC132165149 n=1 Tax=Corylus avellana TaxID=13451 RepID=UPI00286D2930|nr:uncharacterized protein LOC132165149 [Corylus avellana]